MQICMFEFWFQVGLKLLDDLPRLSLKEIAQLFGDFSPQSKALRT